MWTSLYGAEDCPTIQFDNELASTRVSPDDMETLRVFWGYILEDLAGETDAVHKWLVIFMMFATKCGVFDCFKMT